MKYHFNKEEHIHSLDGVPLTGTSSVMDVLNKPLAWWASGKAVESLGWTHPKIKKNGKVIGQVPLEDRLAVSDPIWEKIRMSSPEEYLDMLDEAYKAHAVSLDDSAKKGTDLHAELERFVKAKMSEDDGLEFDKKIQPFIDWTNKNVKHFLWSEAHCWDSDLMVGGITDVGAELNDGRFVIIDFKSSKEAYKSHFCQIGGYAIQIEKNGLFTAEGDQVLPPQFKFSAFIVVPFGAEKVEPVIEEEVEKFKEGFRLGVQLYRVLGLGKKHE